MTQSARARQFQENRFITFGLIVSLIIHLALFPTLLKYPKEQLKNAGTEIEVSFEPVSKQQSPQIVSPPDTKESPIAPPPDTSRLSDRNFVTDKETIKRGMPASGEPIAPKPASQSAPERRSPPAESKPPPKPAQPDAEVSLSEQRTKLKTASLRLSKDALVDAFGTVPKRSVSETAPKPQPFSRAPGAGAAFFGSGGTPDYLPSLPDGDMTMLNAKASKYATFVRRVAVQVFAALRSQGWENLTGYEINSAGASTYARAVLNKKGDLSSVEIINRSGSPNFDAVVASSIKAGARDPNPPAEAAAEDGTYRFVFEARSWAVRASDPRTGAPSERRWLMLGTGLE